MDGVLSWWTIVVAEQREADLEAGARPGAGQGHAGAGRGHDQGLAGPGHAQDLLKIDQPVAPGHPGINQDLSPDPQGVESLQEINQDLSPGPSLGLPGINLGPSPGLPGINLGPDLSPDLQK